MSDPTPRLGSALDALLGNTPTQVPRDLARSVTYEQGRGLVQAAGVDARAYVARNALTNTAMLSMDEANFVRLAPHAADRLRAVVDAYAIWAAGEVGRP